MKIKDLVETPRRVVFGAKLVGAALAIVIALQAVIIWLLVTRLPFP